MAAHQNVENEKRVVYDAVKGELEDKIRHLEEDRQNIDINSGMSMCLCIYYTCLCWLHVYGACIYAFYLCLCPLHVYLGDLYVCVSCILCKLDVNGGLIYI